MELDPRGEAEFRFRCKHVNYVSKSLFGDAEAEFLFAPYSAFEVPPPDRRLTGVGWSRH